MTSTKATAVAGPPWSVRLRSILDFVLCLLLLPIWAQQRSLAGSRTVFSTYARQSLSDILADFFPGKRSRWDPEQDMPDQTGRVAIVTGGSSGIGYECARALIRKGARVYVASRSHRGTAEALERLRDEGQTWPGEVKLLACDLSDMNSVQGAVEEFKRQESALHMLICNAGVSNPPTEIRSNQGYDMTLATNVLGHHQLVKALLPVLQHTAEVSGGARLNEVRCVFVSSWCHNMHQPSGFDANDPEWRKGIRMSLIPGLQHTFVPKGFTMELVRYGHSKFLNILQAKKFHRLYGALTDDKGRGIVFTSCDPGNNVSSLLRNRDTLADFLYRYVATPFFLYPPSYGAISPLWACTAPETGILAGQYLAPWARIATPAAPTEDHGSQDRLYNWLEQQLRKHGFNGED